MNNYFPYAYNFLYLVLDLHRTIFTLFNTFKIVFYFNSIKKVYKRNTPGQFWSGAV